MVSDIVTVVVIVLCSLGFAVIISGLIVIILMKRKIRKEGGHINE